MRLELTLSRYLIKPIFSILLAIGATIGVACLLVVLSLFENYYLSIEKIFMGIHPHIEIHKAGMRLDEFADIAKELEKNYPEIEMVRPALYEKVKIEIAETTVKKVFCVRGDDTLHKICYTPDKNVAAKDIETQYGFYKQKRRFMELNLKGIIVKDNKAIMDIEKVIRASAFELNRLEQTKDQSGATLPLGFFMDKVPINVIPPKDFLFSIFEGKQNQHFKLLGTLDLGIKEGELPLLLMSLKNAQNLLNKPSYINTIEIRLFNPYQSEEVAQYIRKYLNNSFSIISWTETEQSSLLFLKITRWMAFAIVFCVSIVAAISVYSTLLLAVMQNRKKISILKALGMKDNSIRLIFIVNALTIGIFGIIMGSLIGYGGSELLIANFSETLKPLGLDDPQTEISAATFLVVVFTTLGLFFITAIIPSKYAISVDIVENLQS